MTEKPIEAAQPQTQVSTSGKLILMGEHSVVHGYPAIAVPFKLLKATAQITPCDGPLSIGCQFYTGALQEVPDMLAGIAASVEESFEKLACPAERLHIKLLSDIPAGRGLGSSAAVAAAIVSAVLSHYQYKPTHEELMALIRIAETHAHGNPSGIDPETVLAEGPICYRKDEPITSWTLRESLPLVVADTGQESDTKSAVAAVQERVAGHQDGQAALARLGELGREAQSLLERGDIQPFGEAANEAHRLLDFLGVSNPRLNDLTRAAGDAGALGAKLTGGGRGGCMFAVARNPEHAAYIADTLSNAGAHNAWCFTVAGRSAS